MIKLTPTQFLVLSSARDRDDGLATRPQSLRAAAAGKLVSSLCNKGFAKEIRAKIDAPVWREDAEGRFALKVLKAGRLAAEAEAEANEQIALANDEADERDGTGNEVAASSMSSKASGSSQSKSALAGGVGSAPAVRPGSKRASVVALLRRPTGATMAELIASTGWLPHTTRAALTGLRKSGFALERFQDEDLAWKYKIGEGTEGASANAMEMTGGRASARSVLSASVGEAA
jgi:hypothetical protein